jgi:Leucine-rich repeat (LRR) protein
MHIFNTTSTNQYIIKLFDLSPIFSENVEEIILNSELKKFELNVGFHLSLVSYRNLKLVDISFSQIYTLEHPLPPLLENLILKNNKLSTFPKLPTSLVEIDISNNKFKHIPSLKYTNLKKFICFCNEIDTIEDVPDTLEELDCDINQLNYLPLLPDNLKILSCNFNKIEILPKLPNNLKFLYFHGNYISDINQIDELENLLDLDFSRNSISYIPSLAQLKYLRYLNCERTNARDLPQLPDNLIELKCSYMKLESINNLPKNLEILNCEMNQIIELENIPNKLKSLNCSHNKIEKLILPEKLDYLYCEFNQLKEIPIIRGKLKELNALGNKKLLFTDLNSWVIISNFKKCYYHHKYGKRLENYYIKNVRNKNINLELLYSPNLKFYKMKWNEITLKYI